MSIWFRFSLPLRWRSSLASFAKDTERFGLVYLNPLLPDIVFAFIAFAQKEFGIRVLDIVSDINNPTTEVLYSSGRVLRSQYGHQNRQTHRRP